MPDFPVLGRIASVLVIAAISIVVGGAQAADDGMVVEPFAYEVDGVASEGVVVYAKQGPERRPAVLMVPNWMGMTAGAVAKAKTVAGHDRVVFIADVYGKDVRPANTDEARAAATALRSDRPLLRRRTAVAMDTLVAMADSLPLDVERRAAIGFCFGGGAVLELARSGYDIPLVVSFHGNLDSPLPAQAETLKSRILVLHGADDPLVPDDMVAAFMAEMRAAQADWQVVSYGGAVHSFTNPQANNLGTSHYHPVVAARSFAALDTALEELTP